MNRREFISLTPALAAGTMLATGCNAFKKHSKKKGIGYYDSPHNIFFNSLRQLNVSWAYNWHAEETRAMPRGVEFFPMAWGFRNGQDKFYEEVERIKASGAHTLLCFNEPDHSDQAYIPVEKVLEVWPFLEKTGMRLSAPACGNPFGKWMRDFMAVARERKYRMDFLNMHDYCYLDVKDYGERDAQRLVDRITKYSRMYDNRPVWLTEMGIADFHVKKLEDNAYKMNDIAKFMRTILPKLEQLEIVERYAWFHGMINDPNYGNMALVDLQGELTILGQIYSEF